MPDHVKKKILLFFVDYSVPRILAEERKKKKELSGK